MKSQYLRVSAGLLAASIVSGVSLRAQGSSHREAPLIAEDPAVDNTDLWAFTSPDPAATDTVTIIAAYNGLEEPASAPNWPGFSDNALYNIYIDNTGDGVPDITYGFQFRTTYNTTGLASANSTFLYNVTPVDGLPTPANFHNTTRAITMNVTRRVGTGPTMNVGMDVPTAPPYIGYYAYGGNMAAPVNMPFNRTVADTNYTTYANAAITNLSTGERVFAGPRDDPFYVDLAGTFDDVTLRMANGTNPNFAPPQHLGDVGGGTDNVAGYNVHIIAIQIPVATIAPSCPTTGGPGASASANCVVAIYAAASRPRVTILRNRYEDTHGQMVQVSRLGQPLINEVIIPLSQKDYWNTTTPWTDVANFGTYLVNPSLPTYVQALYGPSGVRAPVGYMAPTRVTTGPSPMNNDMVQLITGNGLVPGVPTTGAGFTPCDELRLNVRTPPSTLPTTPGNPTLASGLSRLGAAGGDGNGYPNGRRLFDDIVDIEERYVLNGLGMINAIHFGDGVDGNDVGFGATFPYVPIPHSADENVVHRVEPPHAPNG